MGALSYVWSPVDSLLIPLFLTLTLIQIPILATRLQVRMPMAVQILITVLPLPNVDAGNDTTICPGLSVQLNATGGSTYQWLIFNKANPIAFNNLMDAYRSW